MKCVCCQGEMKRDLTPFQVNRKGYHLVLDAVPAWVCTQCGESHFEEHEVDAIQRMLEQVDERARELAATP
ncbi:YgiT-type zinc finger protein [bacterium]|nr:YgiT-type zinc finger protein [bacterium]